MRIKRPRLNQRFTSFSRMFPKILRLRRLGRTADFGLPPKMFLQWRRVRRGLILEEMSAAVRSVLLLLLAVGAAHAQNPAATISVHAAANVHHINPNIYGMAYASTTALLDLNIGLNRQGGNNTSRYNWMVNGDNRGADWFFESIGDSSAVAGERGDTFIAQTHAAGAQPLLTIPMIGWVAKLGANRSKLSSFSQSKYGAQTNADWQWFPDAGNGILSSTGQFVTGNDANDANVPADAGYQQSWVRAIVTKWGPASRSALLHSGQRTRYLAQYASRCPS